MSACVNCESTDLFTLEVTVAIGPARFAHCRSCEHHWWTDAAGGRELALSEVLVA